MEIIPRLGRKQVPHHLELGAAHGEDLVAQPGLVVASETLHVDRIVAHELADLFRELGRVREDILVGIRRQETAHADAVDPPRRVAGRNSDDDRSFALTREMVPDGRRRDRSRRRDFQAVVRVIGPVAEAVNAERAGVLTGRHAHPGGNGDRWDHALQASVGPGFHQPPDVRQVFVAEEKLGSRTVEPQYQDFHDKSDSPSIAGPLGTPRAARIEGARSSSRAPSPRNGLFMNKTPGTRSGSIM